MYQMSTNVDSATMATKRLLLTVKETCELLRITRSKIYDLIKDGSLEGLKIGSDWRIKTASIERLLGAELTEEHLALAEKQH